jgi:restriction endonuclease Mrr
MPIPDYENLVEPMLKVLCADGEDAPKSLLVSRITDELQLDPVEAQAMLPSGTCTVLEHRIDWARSYLQGQGLVEGSLNRGIRLTKEDGTRRPIDIQSWPGGVPPQCGA